MAQENQSIGLWLPRWGTPRQWYWLGFLGLVVSLGAAVLLGFGVAAIVEWFVHPVGSFGLLLFFGGLGIGVTKSRERDRGMDSHD